MTQSASLTIAAAVPLSLPLWRRHRQDLVCLKEGRMDCAQKAKVELEQLQRKDRKLRAEAAACRVGLSACLASH